MSSNDIGNNWIEAVTCFYCGSQCCSNILFIKFISYIHWNFCLKVLVFSNEIDKRFHVCQFSDFECFNSRKEPKSELHFEKKSKIIWHISNDNERRRLSLLYQLFHDTFSDDKIINILM